MIEKKKYKYPNYHIIFIALSTQNIDAAQSMK